MRAQSFINAGVLSVLYNAAQITAQTPPGFSPSISQTMEAAFDDATVSGGNTIVLADTTYSPSITLPSTIDSKTAHVVMMIDLDAPGGMRNQSYSPLLHWLVAVPAGTTSLAYNSSAGIAPYIGPAPTAGDGPHRYVVLAFESPETKFVVPAAYANLTFADITQRLLFNVTKFVDEAALQTVSANWFTTEAVAQVPTGAGGRSTVDMVGSLVVAAAALMVVG